MFPSRSLSPQTSTALRGASTSDVEDICRRQLSAVEARFNSRIDEVLLAVREIGGSEAQTVPSVF